MKNIFLLIFLLIFLYIICNRCIEKFSVGGQINISDSLTLSYIDICINQHECMKIWNDFLNECKGSALDPHNPNLNCCKQLNIFYPIHNACKKIYDEKGVEMPSEDTLLRNYNICNKL